MRPGGGGPREMPGCPHGQRAKVAPGGAGFVDVKENV
jgi:hypothetical protein